MGINISQGYTYHCDIGLQPSHVDNSNRHGLAGSNCSPVKAQLEHLAYWAQQLIFHFSHSTPGLRCHSDMCIPIHISLVICVSLQYGCQWNVYPLPPTPPNKCRFYFCCFCEFCKSSSKGLQMIQDYEQHNWQKSNDSRQNNRKAVSGEFTSSWAAILMSTFVLAPLPIQRDKKFICL